MTAPVILFVDDEPNVLSGIRRGLHKMEGHWTMLYATSGQQALDMLLTQPVAVVVTDIAMPAMDGETLIRRLYDQFPHVAVVVLSGHWTQQTSDLRVGPSVRFLSKPVNSAILTATIVQALRDACLVDPQAPLPGVPDPSADHV
ncbi:response regulator [Magnetospirillum sp. 64-120]|uniref:response regulator n=1 Tax=Magnetospirillum sp. 64-120 TaxID=1895778 RepID=UPI00092BB25D|nr:response regulator [Magnetospirillum sp. 64-120]OJX81285.1 MAG: hypothetical protein BGO92_09580 [Magnetospirillum sp. 64-120]